jgi:hypothetical protein
VQVAQDAKKLELKAPAPKPEMPWEDKEKLLDEINQLDPDAVQEAIEMIHKAENIVRFTFAYGGAAASPLLYVSLNNLPCRPKLTRSISEVYRMQQCAYLFPQNGLRHGMGDA